MITISIQQLTGLEVYPNLLKTTSLLNEIVIALLIIVQHTDPSVHQSATILEPRYLIEVT